MGAVFRNSRDKLICCFHHKDLASFAFEVELLAATMALEVAMLRNFRFIWLEADSSYVVSMLLKKDVDVPSRFKARSLRILDSTNTVQLHVSHIFREGKPSGIFYVQKRS